MEADGHFVCRKSTALDLILHVTEKLFELNTNLQPIDANVLVGPAKLAGPHPCFAKHFLVQLAQERLAENFIALLARPLVAFEDI